MRPDLVVVSAKDPTFTNAATLVDIIDARRWRCGHCVLDLPQDHAYVSLRSPDGAELRFALTGEKTSLIGGEWRLLLTESPDSPVDPSVVFHLTSLSARGDWERLARDQIARSGAKLVWAICQRRHVERRNGAAVLVHLWPTHRIFPIHQSRIVIETIETPVERASSMLRAPFAIMENWLRENGAPRATFRIRVRNSLEQSEFMLGRTAIVLVMHQRRRLRDWIQKQREAGDPIVDPLTFDDIRRATGHSLECPEAVEASSAIIVHNLLNVIASSETTEFDGLSIRRLSEGAAADAGAIFDIDFFGAALGDDVGLVSTAADAGDFGVVPSDPGGAPYVRLFRVESDGLRPCKIEDEDVLLDEILRLAADEESGATGTLVRSSADRAASAQGRREKLLVGLNSSLAATGYAGRFHAAKLWDLFEPVLLSSFVALVMDAASEARAALLKLGGYDAYRADPSLVQALLRQHEFTEAIEETTFQEHRGGSKSLVYRFVGACRVPGLVTPDADLPAQIQIWRLLMQAPLMRRLTTARITLNGAEGIVRNAVSATESLLDEATVERAAVYCDDLELEQEAGALRGYLLKRRDGEWTPLHDAARLAVVVEEANAYWKQLETDHAASAADAARSPTPAKPGGFFSTMRNFFGRGASKSSRP